MTDDVRRAEELYSDIMGTPIRQSVEAIAAAFAAERDRAIEEERERCAKIADAEADANDLAATNPASRSMAKCLPYMADDCRRIAAAIRSQLKGG